MKIYLELEYWNPLLGAYRPVPAGLLVNVYDEDVGFHDHIGTATTTGRMLEIDALGWGDFEKPDVYFELVTQDRRIELKSGRLVEVNQPADGPVLILPPGRWDSRTHGPARVFEAVDPIAGLGTAAAPGRMRLEAGRAWFSPVYWNRLAPLGGPGASHLRGAHRPAPAGITFHLQDPGGAIVGRGQVDSSGLLYVPMWAKVESAALNLDADYRQPLIIDLAAGRVATGNQRSAQGDFLTITSWEQGHPMLSSRGPGPRYYPVVEGTVGAIENPIAVDISSSPWTFGNRVKHLVDGDETFLAMAAAIRSARQSIHLSGWDFEPTLWVDRLGGSRQSLADLLLEQADAEPTLRLRVLVWANPVHYFALRSVRKQLQDHAAARNRNVQIELSSCPEPRSHHQKLLVIDGRIGFVGGIDWAWGRWDTHDHRPGWNRQSASEGSLLDGDFGVPPWHDVHTQLEGPVVAAIEHNFAARWKATVGETLAGEHNPPVFEDGVPVLPVRTWPKEIDGCEGPEDELSIRTLYLRAISSAQRNIYIEQQYLNNKGLTKALASRLSWARQNDVRDFRLTIVLPSFYDEPSLVSNHMTWLQEDCLQMLRQADPERRYLRLFCLKTWDEGRQAYRPIYIHAKLMIVDDRWLTVGSANSNNRSLEYDTELNVAVEDPVGAIALRRRLCEEHAREPLPTDHAASVDRLLELARANAQALEAGQPGHDPLARRVFPHRPENVSSRLPLPDDSDVLF